MAKSKQERSRAELIEELLPLLEVTLVALMTDDVETAHVALKDQNLNATQKCRKAIAGAFETIFDGHIKRTAEERFRLEDDLKNCRSELCALKESMCRLHARFEDEVLRHFLDPHAKFMELLEKDHAKEKERIAKRAVERYFKDPVRCFVQASSLAIFLGREIALNGAGGILIHTNSVPFPMTVLRDKSSQFVYSFCGGEYDPFCAGWLFGRRDEETTKSLQALFTRAFAPLDTAFVMPLMVSTDGMLHFRLDQTAHLVELLTSYAKRVVILSVGNRISSPEDDTYAFPLSSCKAKPDGSNANVALIACGPSKSATPQHDLINSLSSLGIEVDWLPSV